MDEKDSTQIQIKNALAEDIGNIDLTTEAILNINHHGTAQIIAKQHGILAGINYAKTTFHLLDPDLRLSSDYNNGARLKSGDIVMFIEGRLASILKAERTALNLLAHLSGVATLTDKYVTEIKGTKAKIADTRKTTPLWRKLEKEAVRFGGGVNHRMGLYDMVLIKENHIRAAGSIQAAVHKCREYMYVLNNKIKIEIETTNLEEVKEALACSVDQIMLDNMRIKQMAEAVRIIDGKSIAEASGGITLKNVKSIAETGVDLISIGALTHSAPAFDFSLLVESAK
jgi:nicotinate-nucleotide pyrophosphorylase (carboxylating)